MSKTFSADEINLNAIQVLSGTSDPTAGVGIARSIGSLYSRAASGAVALYQKTDTGVNDWSVLAQSLGWKSVKDYGAAGDGATDDTAAIYQAISDVSAQGGGTVFVPYGTYLVSQISFLSSLSAVQVCGSGPSSVLKWNFDATGTSQASMITLSAGSSQCVFRSLRFDGSALSNPAPGRVNHLLLIDSSSSSIVETRIEGCTFGNMVASSGDGVHVVGAAGNLVSRLWIHDNEFDGCSRYSVGVEQGWQYGWITDNYITNCETEIAFVSTANVNTDCIQVARNQINHTGTVRHALRFEANATGLLTRFILRENIVLGGFATLQNIQYANIAANQLFSGPYASSDAVVTMSETFSDALFVSNIVDRDPGASAGSCIAVQSVGGIGPPVRFGIAANNLIQEVTAANFITVVDCSSFRIGNNLCRGTNAGTSSAYAIDCQAVGTSLDNALIVSNQVTASTGSYKAAVRLLANGANVKTVSIVSSQANQIDNGCQFEVGGGGGTFSSSQIQMAGNNFNAATSDYTNVGGAGVIPRVGGNASAAGGCQIFEGTNSPEGVVTASPGSIYLNSSGGQATSVYYKESGTTSSGWIGIGGSVIVFGTNDTTAVSSAVFLAPGFNAAAVATELQVNITRPGTIRNLRVQVAAAGTGSQVVTYTFRKNATDTAVLATINNTATGSATDLVHTVTVAAGDLISIKCTKAAGVTTGQAGVVVAMELV